MRTTRLLGIAAAMALALPAAANAAVTHSVRRGETLTSIAATDGLSVSQLAAANGLAPTAELTAGRLVVIPPQGETVPAATATATAATAPAPVAAPTPDAGGFLVSRGDTLSAIAAQYGTSVPALAAANGMSPDGLLLAGRTLAIPSAGESAPAEAAATTTASSDGASAVATDAFVSPSQVGDVAAQDDVSPALAEAIADQESGFNDDEVSRTGAVGVMQIEPGTWRDLTGPDGLRLSGDSALDNVRGGVSLLHGLLAQTGGDESEAIAAYYQGLDSVRAQGMYPSTRRYVRDVLALQGRY